MTPVITNTYTPSLTLTPTMTITPNPNIAWAPSNITVTDYLRNTMAAVLHSSPPPDVTGNVYGILAADSDGSSGWYISLSALTGISPPYTGWDALADGQWMGSLHCTGTEPAWSCEYYAPTLPPAMGAAAAATGLLFPFQTGTWARYGELGVHHDGNGMLPNDSAVDFKGDDSWGPSVMPARAYAAAAGTVISHCDGAHQGGIVIDGPSGRFMYFHLLPGQPKMSTGTVLSQGEEIGSLAYGNWNDSPCGVSTINSATGYHLHFAFLPVSSYFEIGGCSLDLSTQAFLCGTDTIHPGGQLNNGGGIGPAPTVTPGGPTVTPGPNPEGGGGEHIWNGLISGIITWLQDFPGKIFPAYTSHGFTDWFNNLFSALSDFAMLIAASGLIWIVPSITMFGIIVLAEMVRLIYVVYRFILHIIPFAD